MWHSRLQVKDRFAGGIFIDHACFKAQAWQGGELEWLPAVPAHATEGTSFVPGGPMASGQCSGLASLCQRLDVASPQQHRA